jgi:hypothetical protein
MDCLECVADGVRWLYTNGFFALFQLVIVILGLGFTVYQIRHAARTFEAGVVGQLTAQSSNLQWEFVKDAELLPVITGVVPRWKEADVRRSAAIGIVINHFAAMYDLYLLGGIPDGVWKSFAEDLKATLGAPAMRQRWAQLKRYHRAEFVAYVDATIASSDAPAT